MRYLIILATVLFSVATAHAQLSLTTSITPISCFGGSDGMIQANVTGGTPPYNYSWVMNGNPLFVTGPNLTGLPACYVFVYVTDDLGATVGDTIEMFDPQPWQVNTTATPASCGVSDGSITVSVFGGVPPYTFTWSNGSTTQNQQQLPAGTYLVTITDVNGCEYTESATVNNTGNLSVTTTVQYDTCQGTACIIANSVPNATYTWSNGQTGQQICGLADFTYSVTVTGPSGCTGIASVPITNVTTMQVSATSVAASCGSDGSVIASAVNGSPPYTYLWNTNDTTAQVTNLPAGNYTVTVTDNNGCSAVGNTTISSGVFTVDSVIVIPATCATSTDGAATVFVTGTNPPFDYAWSDGHNTNANTGLASGTYTVTITDANSCILVQSVTISEVSLQVTTGIITQSNCLTGQSGALFASALNGSAPYSYDWSNNVTGDTITGLSTGGYTVTVTDNSGCSAVRHQFVTSSVNCRARVSGRVYVDLDSDCNNTPADVGVGGVMVTTGGYSNGYTNSQGNWVTYLDAGVYYLKVFNIGNGAHLTNACGVDSMIVTVTDTTSQINIDFPKSTSVEHNVGITTNCGVARPGFSFTSSSTITNYGFYAASGTGSIVLDPIFTGITSYNVGPGIVVDSVTSSPTTLHFHYSGLQPQTSAHITIVAQVPQMPTVALGQFVNNSASVALSNEPDQSLDNNNATCTTVIVGSYDPNDKQVFNTDGGSIDGPATVNDTLLRYYIRFQNTGTDTAFNIVVRDTLDVDLNVSTFRFISASHPVEIEFHEERIIHFVFSNILLPDSNVNEPLSHGFIEFDIEVKDKSQLEELSNQAAIYFDFNPPIYTNTVVTQRIVGIGEKISVPVNVYPNPASSTLTVNLGGSLMEQVEVYDLMGKLVLTEKIQPSVNAQIDVSGLVNGLYLVRVRNGANWHQSKVIISR